VPRHHQQLPFAHAVRKLKLCNRYAGGVYAAGIEQRVSKSRVCKFERSGGEYMVSGQSYKRQVLSARQSR